ncbi:energy-coupling factor ABC transporter ATP-binding protein [Ectobacillus antri]|jgi:energy-coupling factor transport system ATP-binding protein|uniref:Energy-coupling factor ABC transporter ATP-binding protein n=1 Tax=Ectobacillus antri TaxID=2486280 RepID=A0ABT6H6I6_9BACI|nr:energy-coupling factor ABC transporter ATP-binding protein [Ectobacillus antri]MDG4657893.1 energy-coupling factor ABC transporter ATP-binding protein [Ectobacillus antri]MDG5754854.1 energy-coupling factor ABC transporter ATP-binding protein [Ectobacillus antri]
MKEEKLRIEHLSFQYPHAKEAALKDISFSVYQGEWLSIIGQNGSGKSTLAKILNGLLLPNEGVILVNGEIILSEETIWDVREHIGMVFQNPDNQFVGTTVQDDVVFGMENRGVPRNEMIERLQYALSLVGMEEFAEQEPHTLSGGQKQRVAIASVLALRPSILILDEATSMLDPMGRKEVMETVQQLVQANHMTVISITHDLEEAAQSDRIVVLDRGNIVKEGTPEYVFTFTEELRSMGLNVPFSVRLTEMLKERMLPVDKMHLTAESLVNELWTLYLKK